MPSFSDFRNRFHFEALIGLFSLALRQKYCLLFCLCFWGCHVVIQGPYIQSELHIENYSFVNLNEEIHVGIERLPISI